MMNVRVIRTEFNVVSLAQRLTSIMTFAPTKLLVMTIPSSFPPFRATLPVRTESFVE